MSEISTIGLDLAKNVFQVHGVDRSGAVVLRRQLRRGAVEKFFAQLSPCTVGVEACGTAHHWARVIGRYGHQVRLMPPAYVKPYLKRNKNDGRDAEAICEAVSRPTMRFVAVKSIEQQATLAVHTTRALLVRQRTMIANSLRAALGELGIVAAPGFEGLRQLVTGRDHGTGGKHRPGRISKQGDRMLRALLITGASAYLRQQRMRGVSDPWLRDLLARRPYKVVMVALAAKTARIIWAMLAKGEPYRGRASALAAA